MPTPPFFPPLEAKLFNGESDRGASYGKGEAVGPGLSFRRQIQYLPLFFFHELLHSFPMAAFPLFPVTFFD